MIKIYLNSSDHHIYIYIYITFCIGLYDRWPNMQPKVIFIGLNDRSRLVDILRHKQNEKIFNIDGEIKY